MTPVIHEDALKFEASLAIESLRPRMEELCRNRVICSDRSALLQRVMTRMKATDLTSANQYLCRLESDPNDSEVSFLIDGIARGYTDFTRDMQQLVRVNQFLAASRRANAPTVKIWSAACSTGEELYALAMLLRDSATIDETPEFRYRFLGTDVSGTSLKRALSGCFPKSQVEHLPSSQRQYFQHLARTEPNSRQLMKIDVTFQRMVLWRQLDLSAPDWQLPHKFEVILCRNVLSYFTREEQQSIADRLVSQLSPGGLLVFGSCEAIQFGENNNLVFLEDSIYRNESPEAKDNERTHSHSEFFSNPKWDTLQRLSYCF